MSVRRSHAARFFRTKLCQPLRDGDTGGSHGDDDDDDDDYPKMEEADSSEIGYIYTRLHNVPLNKSKDLYMCTEKVTMKNGFRW